MTNNKRREQVSVPLPAERGTFIEREAEREDRTIAGQIRHLVADVEQPSNPASGGRMITVGQAQTAAEPRRARAGNPPDWSDDMDAAPHRRTLLLIAREITEVRGWSIVTGHFSKKLNGWFATTVGNKAAPVQVAPVLWAEALPWPNRPVELLPHVAGGKFKDDLSAAEHRS